MCFNHLNFWFAHQFHSRYLIVIKCSCYYLVYSIFNRSATPLSYLSHFINTRMNRFLNEIEDSFVINWTDLAFYFTNPVGILNASSCSHMSIGHYLYFFKMIQTWFFSFHLMILHNCFYAQLRFHSFDLTVLILI